MISVARLWAIVERGWRADRVARGVYIVMSAAVVWSLPIRGVPAQEMPAPAEIHAPLLVRILTFERTLHDRVGDTLVIGVLYQPRYRPSLLAAQAFRESLQPFREVSGIPIVAIELESSNEATLRHEVFARNVDVLYVAPMRAMTLDTVRAVARDAGILTFSGVPQFVIDGLCVGVGVRGDRPQVLVNQSALESSRIQFSSHLLRLASIVDAGDPHPS